MYHDVHHAEKYGIYQPVGDTVGVGGYSRALRTLGTYKYFALKIKENCPNAWVINYTNPMSLCVKTLYKTFPEIKALPIGQDRSGIHEILHIGSPFYPFFCKYIYEYL